MTKIRENTQKSTPSLDKLAQLQPKLNINELQGREMLKKKARAKYFTNALVCRLLPLDSDLHKSYLNTYYCNSVYEQKENKLTTTYCNNRWCMVCNRIRTAKMINGYLGPIKALTDPYFVTLTVPNVPDVELSHTIDLMISAFSKIVNSWNTHNRENKITGIRKIESTYNLNLDNFHPHFHVVLQNKDIASFLVYKWLKAFPNAKNIAQDCRPADEKSLMELFKYFTKILTNKHDFYASKMDVIFRAMRRRRVYQPFGNVHIISEDVDEYETQAYKDLANEDKIWKWLEHDWVDEDTGECLSGYTPNQQFKDLIDKILHNTDKKDC